MGFFEKFNWVYCARRTDDCFGLFLLLMFGVTCTDLLLLSTRRGSVSLEMLDALLWFFRSSTLINLS